MDPEEKKELVQRIANNLRYCIESRGISQGELLQRILQNHNYKLNQGYLSRILNGQFKNPPAIVLVMICEALNIDIQKIFWENLNQNTLIENLSSQTENKIIYTSKTHEFDKYLGTYHCYFYPTISREVSSNFLYGKLTLELSQYSKECLATFVLLSEGSPEKKYKGKVLLSSSYNCCYCYLMNQDFGEVTFLMFKGISSNQKNLLCQMALALTPSAGGARDITCHRMFLSKRKLSDKGISIVKPHLRMNTSAIFISGNELNELFSEMKVPEKFQNTIKALSEPEEIYCLREEHFRAFDTKKMENYNKYSFITSLRDKSVVASYQKIGKKVNEILYNYLYLSPDNDDFFTS